MPTRRLPSRGQVSLQTGQVAEVLICLIRHRLQLHMHTRQRSKIYIKVGNICDRTFSCFKKHVHVIACYNIRELTSPWVGNPQLGVSVSCPVISLKTKGWHTHTINLQCTYTRINGAYGVFAIIDWYILYCMQLFLYASQLDVLFVFCAFLNIMMLSVSTLMLLVGRQKGHPACKN